MKHKSIDSCLGPSQLFQLTGCVIVRSSHLFYYYYIFLLLLSFAFFIFIVRSTHLHFQSVVAANLKIGNINSLSRVFNWIIIIIVRTSCHQNLNQFSLPRKCESVNCRKVCKLLHTRVSVSTFCSFPCLSLIAAV